MGEKLACIQKSFDFLSPRKWELVDACSEQHHFRSMSVVPQAPPDKLMSKAAHCCVGSGPSSQTWKLKLGKKGKCHGGPSSLSLSALYSVLLSISTELWARARWQKPEYESAASC